MTAFSCAALLTASQPAPTTHQNKNQSQNQPIDQQAHDTEKGFNFADDQPGHIATEDQNQSAQNQSYDICAKSYRPRQHLQNHEEHRVTKQAAH